jgi:hypothetical protein
MDNLITSHRGHKWKGILSQQTRRIESKQLMQTYEEYGGNRGRTQIRGTDYTNHVLGYEWCRNNNGDGWR